jgi:proteasome lid subunit RPN8/RPN11
MTLTGQDLKAIIAHAEEGYPDEVCGIVIGKAGDPKTNAVRRCLNVANTYHQRIQSGIPEMREPPTL